MKIEDIQLEMFVAVTDKYRKTIPASIIWGKGQGQIVGFEKLEGYWEEERNSNIPMIKWADGHRSTMHPIHLQLSTKKAFFIAALQG